MLPYFSPNHNNATPEPEPLGCNQCCLLPLKYVGDSASVITTGRNYCIMSLTSGGKSRRMDDRVVLYYEHSSQGWPTTALITTRLLTNRATFYQQMYVLRSKVDWESGWQLNECLITLLRWWSKALRISQSVSIPAGELQPYPICLWKHPAS